MLNRKECHYSIRKVIRRHFTEDEFIEHLNLLNIAEWDEFERRRVQYILKHKVYLKMVLEFTLTPITSPYRPDFRKVIHSYKALLVTLGKNLVELLLYGINESIVKQIDEPFALVVSRKPSSFEWNVDSDSDDDSDSSGTELHLRLLDSSDIRDSDSELQAEKYQNLLNEIEQKSTHPENGALETIIEELDENENIMDDLDDNNEIYVYQDNEEDSAHSANYKVKYPDDYCSEFDFSETEEDPCIDDVDFDECYTVNDYF